MSRDQPTMAQQVGVFLSALEGLMFAFVAALHWGLRANFAGTVFAAPFLYPAAIFESVTALALLLAVIVPAAWSVRVGRVLLAQILAVLSAIVLPIALLRGQSLTTPRNELFFVVALVLSVASIALLSIPTRRRLHA